jgi:hypothetical protein
MREFMATKFGGKRAKVNLITPLCQSHGGGNLMQNLLRRIDQGVE